MADAEYDRESFEVPDVGGTWYRRCFWLVEDLSAQQLRPCGNSGTIRYGQSLAFCRVHDRKFLNAVLHGLQDDPKFRDALIRHVADFDTDEARLWAEQRKRIRPWAESGPWRAHSVYFAERDGFVKIGRTSNIGKRMHDIGKGSCMPQGMSVGPVRLLAAIHCACEDKGCARERHFHGRFRDKWLEGEWFLLDQELASFIGGLPECLDDDLRTVSVPVAARRPAA